MVAKQSVALNSTATSLRLFPIFKVPPCKKVLLLWAYFGEEWLSNGIQSLKTSLEWRAVNGLSTGPQVASCLDLTLPGLSSEDSWTTSHAVFVLQSFIFLGYTAIFVFESGFMPSVV